MSMTPVDPEIDLLESVVYAKDQPPYLPLPVSRSTDGEVVSCWKLSLGGRLRVLLTGKIYITLLTFNKPLTPIRVSEEKPVYVEAPISIYSGGSPEPVAEKAHDDAGAAADAEAGDKVEAETEAARESQVGDLPPAPPPAEIPKAKRSHHKKKA
jgi:hypothetical protein